jgi:hypothetical protein
MLIGHLLSSGLLTGVRSLRASVVKHTACSTFIGAYEDGTDGVLAVRLRTPVEAHGIQKTAKV